MKTERAASASGACGIQWALIEGQVASWRPLPHHRHQIILWADFIRCWTALLAASSHFLACPFAGLPGHRGSLTRPHSPLPAAVTGLGTATPMTPRIPLTIGCALRVVALSALCPRPPALGAPVGSCRALPAPLLRPIGAGHRALAPGAPLLPLAVNWAEGNITRLVMGLRSFTRPSPVLGRSARPCSRSLASTTCE